MTMDPAAISATVRAFIEQQCLLKQGSLADDVDLFDSGIVDSFRLIELVGFLEASFSVVLAKEDFMSPRMATVAGITTIITDKQRS